MVLHIDSYMLQIGYKRYEYGCCVYVKSLNDDSFVFMLLFIDDILIVVNILHDVNEFKIMLEKEFGMKDLGVAKNIMLIIQFFMSQHHSDRVYCC